ncbi:MAG: NUMOD1 domain-containing DNA-binding protein [Herbinix sp.]|nr:NUMOD1 domain-containing DNA-binding protein [Herbinix sp.]
MKDEKVNENQEIIIPLATLFNFDTVIETETKEEINEVKKVKPVKAKVILQYDAWGYKKGTYTSLEEASHATGISQKDIKKAISKSDYAGGYIWYETEVKEEEKAVKKEVTPKARASYNNNKKHILMLDKTGSYVLRDFNSMVEATDVIGIGRHIIEKSLKENVEVKGYRFTYSHYNDSEEEWEQWIVELDRMEDSENEEQR